MMTKYFCDICGMESDSVISMILAPAEKTFRSVYHEQSWGGDVCEGCRRNILALLEQGESNHHE